MVQKCDRFLKNGTQGREDRKKALQKEKKKGVRKGGSGETGAK